MNSLLIVNSLSLLAFQLLSFVSQADGEPIDAGENCAAESINGTKAKGVQGASNPEFIFINGDFRKKNPGGYLIGDVKITQKAVYESITGEGKKNKKNNQWQAMSNYAREYQMLPFVSYISFSETGFERSGVSKSNKQKMAGEAAKRGVILVLANLFD